VQEHRQEIDVRALVAVETVVPAVPLETIALADARVEGGVDVVAIVRVVGDLIFEGQAIGERLGVERVRERCRPPARPAWDR
jgi:hypothetical protein